MTKSKYALLFLASLLFVFLFVGTVSGSSSPPSITSWGNDYTDNDTISFSIPKYTNVTYNATADYTITTWTWNGATQINGSGATNTFAWSNFTTAGIHTVTVSGQNEYGITETITWTVDVEKSTNLNLTGYINNALGLPLENARVDLNNSYVFSDASGYYSFSGIDENTYTILARAIGYRNATSTMAISANTEMNFTLSERKPVTVSAPGFNAISGLFILAVTIIIVRMKKERR